MRHPKHGNMFQDATCLVAEGTDRVLLDRKKILAGDLRQFRNRWLVYDLSERYFGEVHGYSSKAEALNHLD